MKKIAFIAPYEELKVIADNVINKMGLNNVIETFSGDLSTGLKNVNNAMKNGCTAVISRGGTYELIKEKVDIPIVEIKVTGYDLLRVLNVTKSSNDKKIAVIGYNNVISGARTIAEILGFNIEYLPIAFEEQIKEQINIAYNKGIDVVIGDTLGVRFAMKKGMGYRLIKSGAEAVINSIDEAIKLVEAINIEREKSERLNTILNFLNEGVIAVNKQDEIIHFNPAAEKIFDLSTEDVINKKSSEVIQNTRIPVILKSGQPEFGSIQNTGKYIIATNRVPIIVENEIKGVVATFQDITKIQEMEEKIRLTLFKKGFTAKKNFNDIVGNSRLIKKAINLSKRYAEADSTILITGESGTGKEVFAQSIHNFSSRKNGPFVAVNCAAIPGNLLESELFGYEEGAFTGARKGGKKGFFELAHRGTIFLDEIGEMDIQVQARVLRVIQEKEVMRIGDDKVIPVDVRVLTATNRNLMEQITEGNFRRDLFYRINVLNINIPSLRERIEDMEVLVDYFIKKFNRKYNKHKKELNKETIEVLKKHDWPGNIRELENVMEKIILIGEEEISKKESFNLVFSDFQTNYALSTHNNLIHGTLKDIELRIITEVLKEEGYNKTKTAKRLGITRVTLDNKLKNA